MSKYATKFKRYSDVAYNIVKNKLRTANSDPKFVTPKMICRIDPNSHIKMASGCRAGLANRIRSLIALNALGFEDVRIYKERLPDQHDAGEKDLDELFTKVKTYKSDSEYDYIYRSQVLPSMIPAEKIDNRINKNDFNNLNYMGQMKPEVLNFASGLKTNFKKQFINLGLHQIDENTINKKIASTLAIHIRHWEVKEADEKFFRLGDVADFGARLWERELLSKDNVHSLVSRIENDVKEYGIKNIVVYSDSQESLNLFDGTSISHLITSPEIVAEGWSQALNEIISLSRHKVIYAFPMSTFSHMSCLLADDETLIRSVY
ncbi:MAG: hypothetical protein DHS20C07_15310 [Methyloligella sp.]|nr:MAG: hypothetical protein DHS20C07_15310 [Methyloligella sp.]